MRLRPLPQATHHPCHRPVRAGHADQAKVFPGGPGATRKAEKGRLRSEYERARRVLSGLDAASSTTIGSCSRQRGPAA
ncbi:hypothetical protein KNE206_61160 [Kitasatospora sp. NE20-6]|uniref:hypothetical protein n=1 Tax=Kitasatospora sp. NE20-6 TaxID=2859066 RepID=UPI0034DC41B7